MIFEFEHPLLGLYLTSEQNFDYQTYFQLGFSFSFKVIIKKKTINQKRLRIKPMMNDYGCGKGGLDNSGYKEIRPIYGNK